jgi:hypothetical protein
MRFDPSILACTEYLISHSCRTNFLLAFAQHYQAPTTTTTVHSDVTPLDGIGLGNGTTTTTTTTTITTSSSPVQIEPTMPISTNQSLLEESLAIGCTDTSMDWMNLCDTNVFLPDAHEQPSAPPPPTATSSTHQQARQFDYPEHYNVFELLSPQHHDRQCFPCNLSSMPALARIVDVPATASITSSTTFAEISAPPCIVPSSSDLQVEALPSNSATTDHSSIVARRAWDKRIWQSAKQRVVRKAHKTVWNYDVATPICKVRSLAPRSNAARTLNSPVHTTRSPSTLPSHHAAEQQQSPIPCAPPEVLPPPIVATSTTPTTLITTTTTTTTTTDDDNYDIAFNDNIELELEDDSPQQHVSPFHGDYFDDIDDNLLLTALPSQRPTTATTTTVTAHEPSLLPQHQHQQLETPPPSPGGDRMLVVQSPPAAAPCSPGLVFISASSSRKPPPILLEVLSDDEDMHDSHNTPVRQVFSQSPIAVASPAEYHGAVEAVQQICCPICSAIFQDAESIDVHIDQQHPMETFGMPDVRMGIACHVTLH